MRIDFNAAELIHRQIVVDMTIRTLERDRKHYSELKMQQAFDIWTDLKIKDLQQLLRQIKSELSKKGIKIKEEKIDGEYTSYEILERGMTFERRYHNIALKNWCVEEVKRLLGLEYRSNQTGHKKP